MKRVLIINDDGISSPGLRGLARELLATGRYEITVVAPADEQSGVGFHVSLHHPVYAKQTVLPEDLAAVPAYIIWGTPVDCVKLALKGLIPGYRPELVISGINKGSNTSRLIPYSGTVSAALEATLHGVPGIAFSLETPREGVWNFLYAAEAAAWITDRLTEVSIPPEVVINVNVPNRPSNEIRGIRLARQGRTYFDEYYVEEEADREGRRRFRLEGSLQVVDESEELDGRALKQGWITVTPLTCNQEHPSFAEQMRSWPLFAAPLQRSAKSS